MKFATDVEQGVCDEPSKLEDKGRRNISTAHEAEGKVRPAEGKGKPGSENYSPQVRVDEFLRRDENLALRDKSKDTPGEQNYSSQGVHDESENRLVENSGVETQDDDYKGKKKSRIYKR